MENKTQVMTRVSVPSQGLSTRVVIQKYTAEKGKFGANYKMGTCLISPETVQDNHIPSRVVWNTWTTF